MGVGFAALLRSMYLSFWDGHEIQAACGQRARAATILDSCCLMNWSFSTIRYRFMRKLMPVDPKFDVIGISTLAFNMLVIIPFA
jgi:hypothetical protein